MNHDSLILTVIRKYYDHDMVFIDEFQVFKVIYMFIRFGLKISLLKISRKVLKSLKFEFEVPG